MGNKIVLDDIPSRSKTFIQKTLKVESDFLALSIKQFTERKYEVDNILESLRHLIQASSTDSDVNSSEAKEKKKVTIMRILRRMSSRMLSLNGSLLLKIALLIVIDGGCCCLPYVYCDGCRFCFWTFCYCSCSQSLSFRSSGVLLLLMNCSLFYCWKPNQSFFFVYSDSVILCDCLSLAFS